MFGALAFVLLLLAARTLRMFAERVGPP